MTRPPPLVALRNATFHHSFTGRALFPNTTLTIPSLSPAATPEKWTVLGPSKSTFLSILGGSLHASPPNSRLYPAFSAHNKWPQSAIQTVSFGAGSGQGMLKGAMGGDGYVSARYETLREEFDVTLQEWLGTGYERRDVESVARELGLADMLDQDVMTLSNGQSRRARVAQALLRRPEMLIVDEPFMGLDPPSKATLSTLLHRISTPTEVMEGVSTTPVVVGLRMQDPIPSWSTHLAFVDNDMLVSSGEKDSVISEVQQKLGQKLHREETCANDIHTAGVVEKVWAGIGMGSSSSSPSSSSSSASTASDSPTSTSSLPEALVEMRNIKIAYFEKVVLSDFSWTIRRGEKWGLFGPNGSGKTTLTSLITSDHPLSYSLDIRHFGRPRLPEAGKPGISVWDIQSRIGISSPEIHSFFPRYLSLRRCVRSGFADTFLTPPKMTPEQEEHVAGLLESFKDLLPEDCGEKAWDTPFSDTDLSTQRLALFLRAIAPKRDLVVLDEAFSGMKEKARNRCFELLKSEEGWEEGRQAMVVISHASEEVPPGVEKWVRLGEKGGKEKAVFGTL